MLLKTKQHHFNLFRMAIGFINNDKQYDTGLCVNANYAVRVAVKVGPSSTPLGYLQPPAIPFEIDVSN
jgi:hypothetical protein